MTTPGTHTIVKELITAGIPEKHAEAFIERFATKEDLNALEKEHSQFVTKEDIIGLEYKVENVVIRLESKLDGLENRLGSKLDNMETRLESSIRDLGKDIGWLKTITIANFTLLLGGVITILCNVITIWLNK